MNSPDLENFYKLLLDFEDYLTVGRSREHAWPITLRSPYQPVVQDAANRLPAEAEEAVANLNSLTELQNAISVCRQCALSKTRRESIRGEGSFQPLVMVVGDAPSTDDESLHRPFMGQSGQFLDKWLESIGLNRENCYLTYTVKCRPPQARNPKADEVEFCYEYLEKEVEFLKPKIILACGPFAAQTLTGRRISLDEIRQNHYQYQGIPVIATYHPAHVLKNLHLKRPVWEDLKKLKSLLDQ